ncbi:MAG TPA: LacI family DNA-binding transcriptional regulator [Devosia sp.]|uniref:LacI family DNA-binding transcriptional regulator n=1 Tax=Devosia sp. TaxID=1871048 RepID=UPI002F94E094
MGRRVTQRDIARMASVSQATVSLVLNGVSEAVARIPAETRKRVQELIVSTGYVADPAARSLVNASNRILGVFTYEPAFPSGQADFFTPFLFGIEETAQNQGYDLLLFTGRATEADGRKRIFHAGSRLRMADGCLLLGIVFDQDELLRLIESDYPFVAIGRREDASGRVPYVGADYVTATADLAAQAMKLGHSQMAYVGPVDGAESRSDRWQGFARAIAGNASVVCQEPGSGLDPEPLLDRVLEAGATIVFFVELADAVPFRDAVLSRGLSVPEDLSIVVLGSHVRASAEGIGFTTYAVPREEMGRQATDMLVGIITGKQSPQQILLKCNQVPGETLGPAKARIRT